MKKFGSSPELFLGQHVLRNLGNACFGFFVTAVLICTVIALSYKPTDPWMEPSTEPIAKVFSSFKNATFKQDETVLRTGEDFNRTDASASEMSVERATQALMPIITNLEVEEVETHRNNQSGCDLELTRGVNCSDPAVLAGIVRFNLVQFPNLNFFEYQAPVSGSNEFECDVAWKFRSKKEKSWRMYRDYRRFQLAYNDDCTVKVDTRFGWHSGKNTRNKRRKPTSTLGGLKPKPEYNTLVPTAVVNLTSLEEVDVIDDSAKSPSSPDRFNSKRYLYYTVGGDRCKSMPHFLWSFLCALGEAQYLNRTFVVDLSFCLSAVNNPGHGDDYNKDLRLYFDYVHLKEAGSVVELQQFLDEWKEWDRKHRKKKATLMEVTDYKVTPMQLKDSKSTIIQRKFELPEPDNYWYRVCEGETEKVIERPWHLLWKSKRIMDIVNAICGKMEWDFDAVHLVRGEKASNKEQWPNLDADTSPDSLLWKLKAKLEPQRYVYFATDEADPSYFERLKQEFHVVTLDTFKDLWEVNSVWYNETTELLGGRPVEFDGHMRAEVDTEVMYRAKKRLETFNDLTSDCKNGVNAC